MQFYVRRQKGAYSIAFRNEEYLILYIVVDRQDAMVFEVLVVYSVHIHTMTSASQDRKLSIAIITHFLNQKAI